MVRTRGLTLFVVVGVSSTFAQDIVKLAPGQVKVEFENAQVRVLRFTEPAAGMLPMHSHPASVTIQLTGGHSRFTFPDGKTQEVRGEAGSVTFSNAITHTSENLGKDRSEVILVELKNKPAGMPVPGDMDAAKIDPKHHNVELNNDFVRVLRVKIGPHEKEPMHEHPATLAVSLTDGHFKLTLADGKTMDYRVKAGEVRFRDPVKHAAENLSDKPHESIVVEPKTAT